MPNANAMVHQSMRRNRGGTFAGAGGVGGADGALAAGGLAGSVCTGFGFWFIIYKLINIPKGKDTARGRFV